MRYFKCDFIVNERLLRWWKISGKSSTKIPFSMYSFQFSTSIIISSQHLPSTIEFSELEFNFFKHPLEFSTLLMKWQAMNWKWGKMFCRHIHTNYEIISCTFVEIQWIGKILEISPRFFVTRKMSTISISLHSLKNSHTHDSRNFHAEIN